jgi:uncharacterized protein DUF1707
MTGRTAGSLGPLAGPDHLRVGDAERDEVAVALHDHFAQGRLTRDELDERLEVALSATTVGDLREVTRDLPGPHTGSGPRQTEPEAQTGPGPWGGPSWAPHGRRQRHWPGHHRHVHGHRGPGFQLAPLLLGIVLIAVIASGPGSVPLSGIVKSVLLVWLVLAVLRHLLHHRHHRR